MSVFLAVLEESKKCSVCNSLKPLTEYNKHKSSPGGWDYYCRACVNKKRRIRDRQDRQNPAAYQERKRKNVFRAEQRAKGLKHCAGECGEWLPKDRFSGSSYYCKDCAKIWRAQQREHELALRQTWKAKNRERLDEQVFRDRCANYGITPFIFYALLEAQNYTCAICPKAISDQKRGAHIDHDHNCCAAEYSCGKCVRGLLCDSCNKGLGLLGDCLENLEKAIVYLQNYHIKRENMS